MRRWLLKQDDAVDEPDIPIATDADLQCTRTGQVLATSRKKSRCSISIASGKLRSESRTTPPTQTFRSLSFAMMSGCGLGLLKETARPLKPQVVSTTSGKGFAIRKLVFEVEPGITLPAVDITREGRADGGPTVVKVGVNWKEELASEKETEKIPSPATGSCFFNPRGWVRPARLDGSGRPSPFGDDWKEAYMAVHMDRPLLGQHSEDLLQVLGGPRRRVRRGETIGDSMSWEWARPARSPCMRDYSTSEA